MTRPCCQATSAMVWEPKSGSAAAPPPPPPPVLPPVRGGSVAVGATAVEASDSAPVPVAFTARTLNW